MLSHGDEREQGEEEVLTETRHGGVRHNLSPDVHDVILWEDEEERMRRG